MKRLRDYRASPPTELKALLPWRGGNAASRWLFRGATDRLLTPESLTIIDRSLSPAERAVRDIGAAPPRRLGTMLWTQSVATNLALLLHYEDRSSMAPRIEARVPVS